MNTNKRRGTSRRRRSFLDRMTEDFKTNPAHRYDDPITLSVMGFCTLMAIVSVAVMVLSDIMPRDAKVANAAECIEITEMPDIVDQDMQSFAYPTIIPTERIILASAPYYDAVETAASDNGMDEYVHTAYVVSEAGLNVRSEPTTESNIVRVLNYGEDILTAKRNDEWIMLDEGNYVWANSVSLEKPAEMVNMGSFLVTAYCTCHKCCHPYDSACTGKPSKTASGTRPVEGRTIAVDPRVIPLGSKVRIDGHDYIAEDMGGAIKGNRIDIFIDSHSRALDYESQRHNVYLYK